MIASSPSPHSSPTRCLQHRERRCCLPAADSSRPPLLCVVSVSFSMGSCNENILVWNVRGLNSRTRRDAVRDVVRDERVSLLCLEETKMDVIPSRTILEMLGLDFDYSFLPAVGRFGGVLLAWRTCVWSVSDVHLVDFSLTALVRHSSDDAPWWLSVVYGPQEESEKLRFLDELRMLRSSRSGPWAVAGDFNLILDA